MQIVYIDLIPQKEKPVVNLSQFDNDRVVRFMLLENGAAYTLAGTEEVECDIKKPDGNIVVIVPTIGADNYIDVYFTEQAAACYGRSFGEISIHDNITIIGTCNFYIDVEISPTHGGIESDSAIANLQTQIDDIISGEGYLKADDVAPVALSGDYNDLTNKPDLNNYYTKSEADSLLNAKADKSTTYTKSETDALLALKANTSDLATVATTGDYADLINKPTIPANTSDLVNDSDFQNETEVNDLIADALLAVMPVDSATGNPCTFDTDIATSLVGLSADIVASGGGGTPSSPIPIVGHSALNVDANGDTNVVQFGQTIYIGEYDAKSGSVDNKGYMKNAFTASEFGLVAINQYGIANFGCHIDVPFDYSKGAICNALERQYTVGSDTQTEGFFINAYDELYIRVEATRASTPQDLVDWLNGNVEILFTRVTPVELVAPELSIDAVVGTNTITSDGGGDVTASYKVSIQKYIDDHT